MIVLAVLSISLSIKGVIPPKSNPVRDAHWDFFFSETKIHLLTSIWLVLFAIFCVLVAMLFK